LGYSLIPDNPNWVGKLTLPQVYGLLDGFSSLETKKSDSVKKQTSSQPQTRSIKGGQITKKNIDSVAQLKNLPFVQKVKRK